MTPVPVFEVCRLVTKLERGKSITFCLRFWGGNGTLESDEWKEIPITLELECRYY